MIDMLRLPPVPEYTRWSFIALVACVTVAIVVALRLHASAKATLSTGLCLVLWLALTGALTRTGFFEPGAGPPRLLLGILPAVAAAIALTQIPRSREWLTTAVPAAWVVGLQVFRLPVELVLLSLSHHGIVPTAMTFDGQNFDIVTGLTAPAMAMHLHRSAARPHRRMVIAWNIGGLLLLANVMRIAAMIGARPNGLPLNAAPNLVPYLFPYSWLPYFLVPLALFLHLVSLGQLLSRRQPSPAETSPPPEPVA
jgi:hypothetical protein